MFRVTCCAVVAAFVLLSCQCPEKTSGTKAEGDPLQEQPAAPRSAAEMPPPLPGLEEKESGGAEGARLGARGGTKTAEAIQLGLDWLVRHQDANGRWRAAEFMSHDAPGADPCTGPGNPVYDIGATSLALLAMLADGSTLRTGPYREPLKKGIAWLRHQQQDDGLIGREAGHAFMYNHGIATVALVEAYGLSKYGLLKRNCQRAVNYILKARNPYRVWRYYPQDGQNDSSVTTWMVIALVSAKQFGLLVDNDALKFAEAWYEEVTDPATGQVGYTKRGEPSSRKAGLAGSFPPERTEALTAAGLFVRVLLGQNPEEDKVLLTAAESMLRKPPKYDPKDGSIDYYYWYYGSMAMFQIGAKPWKIWKENLFDALLPNQRKDGCAKGSWDPLGAWGEDGGRVYTTALAVLALQAYLRYRPTLR